MTGDHWRRRNLLHVTQQQPGIDPDDLATTLRVLASLHHLPGDHPDHVTVKRAASHMYKSIKAERKLAKRAAELAHDRAVIERTATGSPMRIDDETAGIPLVSSAAGRVRRRAARRPRLLHLQAGLHPGRRVLPLALPDVRGDEPRQARPAHRPHRQAGAAHRWAREDRHVHRAPAAPRRRPHHHHHPLPQGRGTPLRRPARQRRLDRTGSRSSASTCATRRRSSRSPTTSRRPARSTSSSTTRARPYDARPGAYAPLVEAESLPLPDDVESRRW